MTAVLSVPGESIRKDFGSLTLEAQLTVDGGFSCNVFVGSERESALSFTVADRQIARSMYRRIAELARTGKNAAEITTILAAQQANVLNQVAEVLATAISNDVATVATAKTVPATQAVAKAHGMAALVQPKPQVRPTMAGAHLIGFISDALFHALDVAINDPDGRVYRGKSEDGKAPRSVLNSGARKGLLHLTAKEGTRASNWEFGTINTAGRNVHAGEVARRARQIKAGAR